jgi:hypothetical protein
MPGLYSGGAGWVEALGTAAGSTPADRPIFRLRKDMMSKIQSKDEIVDVV